MGRRILYSLFTLLAFSPVCKAQQSNVLHFSWPMDAKQQNNYLVYSSIGNTKDLLEMGSKQVYLISSPKELRYSLPKGAIFCRMEDALHQHFNIWLKVRMGSEDKYSD